MMLNKKGLVAALALGGSMLLVAGCSTGGGDTGGGDAGGGDTIKIGVLATSEGNLAFGMGEAKAEATVNFAPAGKSVSIRFDETLLDAGLRQDINLPYECRNGGCGQCKCTVTHGKVDPGLYQPGALSDEERAAG